jgi:hypothetical protein
MIAVRLALLSALLAAPVPEAGRPGVPIPGGVADGDGKFGYLTRPGGGAIDAVDLATGERRWRSTAAERPLLVVDGQLLALAPDEKKQNVGRLVLLDAQNGKELLRTVPIAFPDKVVLVPLRAPPEAPRVAGRSFDCVTFADKKLFHIHWRSEVWGFEPGGPPRQAIRGWLTITEGGIQVDRGNGDIKLLPAEDLPEPKVPESIREAGPRDVTILGDRVYAAGVGEDREVLVLRRWDLATGKALDRIPLRRQYRLQGQIERSGFVVVTNRFSPNVKPEDRFLWVHDLDGRLVGRVPLPPEARGVHVVGPRAYFLAEEPDAGQRNPDWGNRLAAYDLGSGKHLWTLPIDKERVTPLFVEGGKPRR